jgi:hypothetical protein
MVSSLALRIRIVRRQMRLSVSSNPQDQSNKNSSRHDPQPPNLMPAMEFQRSEDRKERRKQELQQPGPARLGFSRHLFLAFVAVYGSTPA